MAIAPTSSSSLSMGTMRRVRTPPSSTASTACETCCLQPIRQNAEQEVAGQVGMWSPPEYVMPMASKPPDVEIAQARNLAVECLAVRQGRTNPDARHGAKDDWSSELRGRCFVFFATRFCEF